MNAGRNKKLNGFYFKAFQIRVCPRSSAAEIVLAGSADVLKG
jgi:hypothetical protein